MKQFNDIPIGTCIYACRAMETSQKCGADLEDGMAPKSSLKFTINSSLCYLFLFFFILVLKIDKIGAGG
jgi:hypothetical protein